MQPGRGQTSGLGVPLLQLDRVVGWVTPVRLTLGVCSGVSCPFAAPGACASAVSRPTWRLFTGEHTLCVPCAMSAAAWYLFTGVRAVCGTCVLLVVLSGTPPPPPPLFFPFFSSFCACSELFFLLLCCFFKFLFVFV